jgi:hypothetical protein
VDVWYLIIRTPVPSIHVWPLHDGTDPVATNTDIVAALAFLSGPADPSTVDGWDVSYSPGTPHPSLLAQATVHVSPP